MFRFNQLRVTHFKNFTTQAWNFTGRIVCISGLNGSGKTTLLDALYWLGMTKSYFTRVDGQCIQQGQQGFRVEGILETRESEHKLSVVVRDGERKLFYQDDVPYEKLSQHIGRYPVVMIAPDDISIITEAGEERRRFLDTVICQLDHTYMQDLMTYNRALQQRNSLLKQWGATKNDFSLLSVYSHQLHETGTRIFEKRKTFTTDFIPRVHTIYSHLGQESNLPQIEYHSNLSDRPLLDWLDWGIDKDIQGQRTHWGIHRDDLLFTAIQKPFKQVASQGQRKSFLFALKLAYAEILHQVYSRTPVILLDDVFEKLDPERLERLFEYVFNLSGQIFITDTHTERCRHAFQAMQEDMQYINL